MSLINKGDDQRLASIEALAMIRAERARQLELKAAGRFKHTPSDPELSDGERLAMIMEEVGEVARNVLARTGLVTDGDTLDAALKKELSQVAALAAAWMEIL